MARTVASAGLAIADSQRAGVGDEIVTRQNNRLLTTGRSWVKNSDRLVVAATNPDGSMAVRRVSGGTEVMLPADYVAKHVELGYATTSYRSQGRTVDTTHSLVSPTTTREMLYVVATRGRESNMIYDTAFDPDPPTGHYGTVALQSAGAVLAGVFANEGADLSAHETLERTQRQEEDFSVLAAEYETLARVAQQQRWDELLDRSGLGSRHLEQVRQSAAYGPLLAALRDAESRGLDVEGVFPKLVIARALDDAEDPAAVMHGRVDRWTEAASSKRLAASNLIAGLIPRAVRVTDPDMVRALDERDQAMQRRARDLAVQAVERGQVWVRLLGTLPNDPATRERWMVAVSTVAAYRDRWNIDNDHKPLGSDGAVKAIEGLSHRKRAQAAIQRALSLSEGGGISSPQPMAAPVEPSQERSESIAM